MKINISFLSGFLLIGSDLLARVAMQGVEQALVTTAIEYGYAAVACVSSLLLDRSNGETGSADKAIKRESEFAESAQLDRIASIKSQLTEPNHRKYEAIDIALDRVHEGKYGKCQKCEVEIEPALLRALPTATLCIHCTMIEDPGLLFQELILTRRKTFNECRSNLYSAYN